MFVATGKYPVAVADTDIFEVMAQTDKSRVKSRLSLEKRPPEKFQTAFCIVRGKQSDFKHIARFAGGSDHTGGDGVVGGFVDEDERACGGVFGISGNT